jgi:FKBP-type peptidyl-prolyl cis-trans isomerase
MLAMVLFASCSQTEKAPSGMVYKITHGSGNEKLIQQGQIIKFNVEYKLKSKGSVFKTTFGKMPSYIPFDTARMRAMKYDFPEFLAKLRKGDKAEFSLSIDTLEKLGGIQINDFFKKGDFIVGKLEIVNVFATPEMATADKQKEIAKLNVTRKQQLNDFLAKNKINAKETPEGIFMVIKNIGDTTNKIDTSKQVSINYKLYNVKGEVLQTTFDKADPNSKPMDYRVGEVGFIEGWNIGLSYFGKGGTGTIYIPSSKAFVDGHELEFENVIFDIEIVDVKKKEPLPQEGASIMDQMNQNIKSTEETKTKSTPKKKK